LPVFAGDVRLERVQALSGALLVQRAERELELALPLAVRLALDLFDEELGELVPALLGREQLGQRLERLAIAAVELRDATEREDRRRPVRLHVGVEPRDAHAIPPRVRLRHDRGARLERRDELVPALDRLERP